MKYCICSGSAVWVFLFFLSFQSWNWQIARIFLLKLARTSLKVNIFIKFLSAFYFNKTNLVLLCNILIMHCRCTKMIRFEIFCTNYVLHLYRSRVSQVRNRYFRSIQSDHKVSLTCQRFRTANFRPSLCVLLLIFFMYFQDRTGLHLNIPWVNFCINLT